MSEKALQGHLDFLRSIYSDIHNALVNKSKFNSSSSGSKILSKIQTVFTENDELKRVYYERLAEKFDFFKNQFASMNTLIFAGINKFKLLQSKMRAEKSQNELNKIRESIKKSSSKKIYFGKENEVQRNNSVLSFGPPSDKFQVKGWKKKEGEFMSGRMFNTEDIKITKNRDMVTIINDQKQGRVYTTSYKVEDRYGLNLDHRISKIENKSVEVRPFSLSKQK